MRGKRTNGLDRLGPRPNHWLSDDHALHLKRLSGNATHEKSLVTRAKASTTKRKVKVTLPKFSWDK